MEFRDKVLLAFHTRGFYSAREAPGFRGVDPADRRPRGDVAGIPHWTIATRNQRSLDLATAMAEVAAEARSENNEYYVSVHSKPGFGPADAYCVMPLKVFLSVLGELQPDLVQQPNLWGIATASV